MTGEVSGILCDMDGTLIDTNYANYLAYRRALIEVTGGQYDIKFDSTERLNRDSLKKIPELTSVQRERIVDLKRKYFADHLTETRLNADLANFILGYSRVVQCILVTTCRAGRAIQTLEFHNMLKVFSRKIFREELIQNRSLNNKYKYALTTNKLDPAAILVFENEAVEIERAILAGILRENINRKL